MESESAISEGQETAFCSLIIVMLLGEIGPLAAHKAGISFDLGPLLMGAVGIFLVGTAVYIAGIMASTRRTAYRKLAGAGAFLIAIGLGLFLGGALVNALDWVPTGPVVKNPGLDFAVPSVLLFTGTISYLLTLVNFVVAPNDKSRR